MKDQYETTLYERKEDGKVVRTVTYDRYWDMYRIEGQDVDEYDHLIKIDESSICAENSLTPFESVRVVQDWLERNNKDGKYDEALKLVDPLAKELVKYDQDASLMVKQITPNYQTGVRFPRVLRFRLGEKIRAEIGVFG